MTAPILSVATVPADFSSERVADWNLLKGHPLVRAEDGGRPSQGTLFRIAWDAQGLWVEFRCEDTEPWATHHRKDERLWEEEVVEVFLSAGESPPRSYFEVQVNPLGTIFDASIANPDGTRDRLVADPSWDWPGLEARVAIEPPGWRACLRLPWPSASWKTAPLRGNFYRIDRPSNGPPEYSAWSPTLRRPADFHVPSRFGRLELSAQSSPESER